MQTLAIERKMRKKLDDSDMFMCNRWDCRMSKSNCLKRQEKRVSMVSNYWGLKTKPAFPECQGCLQGIQIRMQEMMAGWDRI